MAVDIHSVRVGRRPPKDAQRSAIIAAASATQPTKSIVDESPQILDLAHWTHWHNLLQYRTFTFLSEVRKAKRLIEVQIRQGNANIPIHPLPLTKHAFHSLIYFNSKLTRCGVGGEKNGVFKLCEPIVISVTAYFSHNYSTV